MLTGAGEAARDRLTRLLRMVMVEARFAAVAEGVLVVATPQRLRRLLLVRVELLVPMPLVAAVLPVQMAVLALRAAMGEPVATLTLRRADPAEVAGELLPRLQQLVATAVMVVSAAVEAGEAVSV